MKLPIRLATGILAITLAAEYGVGLSISHEAQSNVPSEQLHGVISMSRLAPALRTSAREVRFSPDGKYFFVQDESGIYVFAREPFSPRLSINAPQPLLARFSTDSKNLIVTTKALNIERYDLDIAWKISQSQPLAPSGCLAAELSPDGELAACYDPDSHLSILRTSTGEEILSEHFGPPVPRHVPIPVPRGTGNAFAEPFGYFYAASMKGWIGRRDFRLEIAFSPNGRFVLARNLSGNVICIEIATRKRIGIAPGLGSKLGQPWCFVAPDRILVLQSKKGGESEVLTFPDGKLVTRLPVSGAGVVASSWSRYLRVESAEGDVSEIFDTESRQFLRMSYEGAADIFENFAVTYSSDGGVALYRIGESQPVGRMVVPLGPLPTLRVAAVSPNLQSFALSVRGAGATYRVATGERVESDSRMKGAWFADDAIVYTVDDLPHGSVIPVQKLQIASGKTSRVWSKDNFFPGDLLPDDVHPSGPVLLAVAPARSTAGTASDVGLKLKSTQAYELHALAMENGKLLWTRSFTRDVPIPFADPQGELLVLAWVATSEAAKSEAKKLRKEFGDLRASNLTEHDTLFEVLDTRNGKIIGAAFAQIGAGPEEFEFVFATRDALILVKDEFRITVLTLPTGRVAAQLTGSIAAASGEANLLAASNGRRLTLYSLKTGTKTDEYVLPDEMAYLHFSVSGKQLFVLTAHEIAFVLDVASTSGSDSVGTAP